MSHTVLFDISLSADDKGMNTRAHDVGTPEAYSGASL
jgi:hypothetical protein